MCVCSITLNSVRINNIFCVCALFEATSEYTCKYELDNKIYYSDTISKENGLCFMEGKNAEV